METTDKNLELEKGMMRVEEYCDDCDRMVCAVFSREDFDAHKVGRIRCRHGHVVMPCQECEDHDQCHDCPWKDAEIVDEEDRSHLKGKKTGRVCKLCGHEVEYETELSDYPYYCPNCDENMFAFETVAAEGGCGKGE